jgi:surfactin synthase thioesterase subunit
MLLADFQVVETYEYNSTAGQQCSCPLTAIGGELDTRYRREQVSYPQCISTLVC